MTPLAFLGYLFAIILTVTVVAGLLASIWANLVRHRDERRDWDGR